MSDEQRPPIASALPEGRKTVPSAPTTGTDTVTVACCIPNGLILRVYEPEEAYEPIYGGGQKRVDKFIPCEQTYTLRGSALDPADIKVGKLPDYPPIGGFALTTGIPADFWELWKKQHWDHPALKNGLVRGSTDEHRAADDARAHAGLESGFEGIDPDNPAKKTGVRGITKAEKVTNAA